MTNTKGENANAILTCEMLNNYDVLAETLKDLTINDARYYNSEEYDAENDPNSNPKVATHTSDGKKRKVTDTYTNNGKYPQKILINRTIPIITTPIDRWTTNGVAACRGTPHAHQMPTLNVIITDTAHSSTEFFRTPGDVSRTSRGGTIPRNCSNSIRSPTMTFPVIIGGVTTVSPTRTGSQDIFSLKCPTRFCGSQEYPNI